MLKSKLDAKKYPQADPDKWLVFKYQNQKCIDPVFAGRLAALAQFLGKKINIVRGFANYDEQVQAYKSYGGYQDENGNWVSKSKFAAVPGTSLHEFRVAIDGSDKNIKELDKNEATYKQITLNKFGLFKPLTPGNGSSVYEDWHIQPIETAGCLPKNRYKFAPEVVDVMDIKEFQMITGLQPDSKAGTLTKTKAKEMLKICQNILGLSYKSAEDVINATQSSPKIWLALLKTVKYFDSFVMNIYKKMRGE